MNDYTRINNILQRMEQGLYTGIKISQVTDRIAWLWRWKKITEEQKDELASRADYIIRTYRPE